MSDETEKKPEEEKKAEEDKPEDKEKTETTSESKALVEALTKVATVLGTQTEVLSKMDEKLTKALEEPTDLPLKPKVSAEDDIGDKVKVPDTYQSNSQQAAIDDSDPKNSNEKDPSGLKMQEKTIEKSVEKPVQTLEKTETPRPSTVAESPTPSVVDPSTSALTQIEKSYANTNKNPILDDFRKVGLEGRDQIAKAIQRGDYYRPSDQEVALF